MIAIILSWLVIFFVFFSAGDICIRLYNKICNNKEAYGILDTFILGMCFVLIPLSLTSLWLPSNQYILLSYIVIAIIYWIVNRSHLSAIVKGVKAKYNTLSRTQKVLIILSIFSIATFIIWSSSFYDASYYHYQHIRWNEEYAVVPGLGNIEDRFGFNSNYMLLSAIFTFRFLFGEAIYPTQALLFALILCWCLVKLFRSKFNIQWLILLVLMFLMFLNNNKAISDSNTDILPSLCIFYIFARTVFEPDWLVRKPLFICLVLVAMVTIKVSSAVLCLLCLVPLIYLMKKKQFREFSFLLLTGTLLIGLWCVRNYYVSGYLVYPLPQVDIFNPDWKMPYATALLQQIHVNAWAEIMYNSPFILTKTFFENVKHGQITYFESVIACIIYGIVIISPILALLTFLLKRKISRYLYITYGAALLSIIFWHLSAPDFRFAYGHLYGTAFLGIIFFLSLIRKEQTIFPKSGMIVTAFVVIALLLSSAKNTLTTGNTITEMAGQTTKEAFTERLIKPSQHQDYIPYMTDPAKKPVPYQMGEVTIYVTPKGQKEDNFDVIPAADYRGLPHTDFLGYKLQNIKTIESRGNTIQDGFRTKEEYITILNDSSNIEEYIKRYHRKYELEGY
ncbi:hypothetical protein [Dysgonomonas sp. 25]|uniref:LIC_10190 family membrane protein n=1 Tax=Dysgonomonas sp. 25 TaxID=2302933 RepID=UPI0013D604F5|nr:hypothetical protein [Dysgonomonas sp. 25]NDV68219.1 hypothetical protein [Dysgonomonas sp. 25]